MTLKPNLQASFRRFLCPDYVAVPFLHRRSCGVHYVGRNLKELAGVATAPNDLFSVEFFDLQLCFAKRVAELSEVSFAEAVGSHTNIYVRLGMGQRLDLNNSDWQDYLAELATVSEKAEWTHAVHARRLNIPAGPTLTSAVGCFSYALIGPSHARLHFHASDCTSESPLSIGNLHLRQRELASLLSNLRSWSSESMQIVGASWLYNLQSYRRLFPGRYLASLQPVAHPYQRMPLWGQFLTRDRRVRPEAKARFLERITQASSLSELDLCFPFSVLTTTSPAKGFYEHIGL